MSRKPSTAFEVRVGRLDALRAGQGAELLERRHGVDSPAMPIYEYRCEACGERFEEFLSTSTKPAPPCPKCGGDEGRAAPLEDQHRVAPERRRLGPRRPQLGLTAAATDAAIGQTRLPRAEEDRCRTRRSTRDRALLRADRARRRAGRHPVRRRPLRTPQLRLRQRRLPRARVPAALVRRPRLRRIDQPARVVHDRGLGRRRREAARRASASTASSSTARRWAG